MWAKFIFHEPFICSHYITSNLLHVTKSANVIKFGFIFILLLYIRQMENLSNGDMVVWYFLNRSTNNPNPIDTNFNLSRTTNGRHFSEILRWKHITQFRPENQPSLYLTRINECVHKQYSTFQDIWYEYSISKN